MGPNAIAGAAETFIDGPRERSELNAVALSSGRTKTLECLSDKRSLSEQSLMQERTTMAKRHLKLVTPATVNRTVRPKRPPNATCAPANT